MNRFVDSSRLIDLSLWKNIGQKGKLFSFELEITARCNNNCRHCYINLPANDEGARRRELSLGEIEAIADEAVSLGALWCCLTGGEPLLREDFLDIYRSLKKKGLLVSILTNGTLVTKEHIKMFQKYPPRDIEVTVYGVTRRTYERVTRRKGSFVAFTRGLDLLLKHYPNIRLKAMAQRSNVHELPRIARFCRSRTTQFFRFDPLLHFRFDGNPGRNQEIHEERLLPEEIVAIERGDHERCMALHKDRNKLIPPGGVKTQGDHLFNCGIGLGHLTIGYDGVIRPCHALWHPDCLYDLRKGNLREGYRSLVSAVQAMRFTDPEFLEICLQCSLMSLCDWCPAKAYLECGRLQARIDYFCRVAHARAEFIRNIGKEGPSSRPSPKGFAFDPSYPQGRGFSRRPRP